MTWRVILLSTPELAYSAYIPAICMREKAGAARYHQLTFPAANTATRCLATPQFGSQLLHCVRN